MCTDSFSFVMLGSSNVFLSLDLFIALDSWFHYELFPSNCRSNLMPCIRVASTSIISTLDTLQV